VAIDAASRDLVNSGIGLRHSLLQQGHDRGGDKFRGVWPHTDGEQQLRYAEHLGLGTSTYRLVRLEGGEGEKGSSSSRESSRHPRQTLGRGGSGKKLFFSHGEKPEA
jgi:hypothetical protein